MCAEADEAMCFVIVAHAIEHGDPGPLSTQYEGNGSIENTTQQADGHVQRAT